MKDSVVLSSRCPKCNTYHIDRYDMDSYVDSTATRVCRECGNEWNVAHYNHSITENVPEHINGR